MEANQLLQSHPLKCVAWCCTLLLSWPWYFGCSNKGSLFCWSWSKSSQLTRSCTEKWKHFLLLPGVAVKTDPNPHSFLGHPATASWPLQVGEWEAETPGMLSCRADTELLAGTSVLSLSRDERDFCNQGFKPLQPLLSLLSKCNEVQHLLILFETLVWVESSAICFFY